MPEKISTQVLVIGGGPGGYTAAIRAGQLGKNVLLVDKDGSMGLGGECLLRGCIPSKTLIHSSILFRQVSEAEKIGINAKELSVNLPQMISWKNKVVKQLNLGINFLCKENNVRVLKGNAFFESKSKAVVETENGNVEVEFENAVIASGSVASTINGFDFDGVDVLSSKEALDLTELPNELVVVGGGYIGLEFGTFFARLGSKVRIIEFSEKHLGSIDSEITSLVQKSLEKLGMEFYLNCQALNWKKENGKLVVEVLNLNHNEKTNLSCDKILVAVGRKPNFQELKLENTKVELSEKGFIKVNEKMQTAEEKIYAVGDVVGNPMLAHKAYREAKIAAENICGANEIFSNGQIPAVVFVEPEIATVGLNEKEAIGKGFKVKIGKFPLRSLGRALTVNETNGFVKIIAEENSHEILGCEIVGFNASDLIGEMALALKLKAKLEDLAETIHPHPTFSEALCEAAESALGKDIHSSNKK